MHFIHFYLTFGIFEKILGFFRIDEVFVKFLGLVLLKWFLKHHALHYICIITMFHAFKYVFTLLQCYVLVGLDWAKPIMYLNLHVTCSCIFMHTYLHFFIFLYIDVFGAFLCVSLSPSLFLSVSYIMAPKRKSTPSQNPLRSRASSSSDPTPSHVRFRNDKA